MPAPTPLIHALQLDGDSLSARLSVLEARRAQHEAEALALRCAGGWNGRSAMSGCVDARAIASLFLIYLLAS